MQTQDLTNSNEGFRPTREELNDFLRERILCTFSTLDENGAPQAATVAFSVATTGELVIGTSEESRKVANVARDGRVAFVATDADKRQTVQIEGEARIIDGIDFLEHYANEHYAQRPESLPFKDVPGQVHIVITPQHIRFSDCAPHPWVRTDFFADE